MIRAFRTIWNSEFFRNVATLISGTSLAQAFSVLIYIILSRIYTEEDFGVFGLYMNILNITVIFSTAKYELAILLPKSERESVNLLGDCSIDEWFDLQLVGQRGDLCLALFYSPLHPDGRLVHLPSEFL